MRAAAISAAIQLFSCAVSIAAPGGDLVAVRVPLDTTRERCTGCTLVQVNPAGQTAVLTPGFAAAKDPSVAFDGRTILFAGRKSPADRWQIWRIDHDGANPVRVLANGGNATSPLHVGTLFHLDDERPRERFVYLSDAHGWADPITGASATALYAANLDGGDPRRISFNLGSDLAPDVLDNGRVVFPSRRTGGRFAMMGLNIDGTDLMAYADAPAGPIHQDMVAVGGGRVYFVSADSPGPLGGGTLEYVSLRRPLRTRTVLAAAAENWYHSPRPSTDGSLIVSILARGDDSGFRLVRLSPETGELMATIAETEGFHLVDAHELSARSQVRGRSSFVDPALDTGVFFCISSHISDRPELRDAARSTTQLRVIEGIPSSPGATRASPPEQRILGVLPIEDDGSFHIEVPALKPMTFELLDATGIVVGRQDGWVWVMPRESRGCVGCHEDREMVPPNRLADAVAKPAVRLPRAVIVSDQTGDPR